MKYKISFDQFIEWAKNQNMKVDLSEGEDDILGDPFFHNLHTRQLFEAYCAGLIAQSPKEFKNLYQRCNDLIAEMCTDGGYDLEGKGVSNLMDALHDLDNGVYDKIMAGK